MTYVVHIAAGVLVVLAGFVALYTTKGATLHRRTGMVFFYAMLTTALFGITIALVRDVAPAVNVPAALLTSYLVVTSLSTIRGVESRWLDIVAFLVVLGVTLASFTFAFQAFANGGLRKGMPAFPFILFGVAGLFATVGDLRVFRSGSLTGARRLARHLWRMSFALFIAALSFFIGQGAKIFPEPFASPALLGLPVLLVLVTMFYWLWRVRVRRNLRGIALAEAA
jgi:uncharacterized membrane protein